MFDPLLRPLKDRLLAPLVPVVGSLHPTLLTAGSFATGVGAAFAAYQEAWGPALGGWIACRVLDGLDGLVARARDRVTELGGVLDLVSDFVVYAAIPLALGLRPGAPEGLLAGVAVLLATFYVNAVAWLAPAALLERRGVDASATPTSIVIPEGLVSGGETVVFYALFFLLPAQQLPLIWTMAALTGLTVIQRVAWSMTALRPGAVGAGVDGSPEEGPLG